MSHYTSLFDKIVIYDPAKSRSACHVFISHQSPAEEKSLGKLLFIAEIESRDGINLDIINAIQNELKHSYFNTDDLNIETAFEKALESVNQKIADMVGDYDTNWLDRFNASAAVVKNDLIHISFVGRTNAFLFRQDKITNIIDTTAVEPLTEKINPLKAFSSVISGNLSPNDVVVFCTSSLLDYLSQEKLKRTVMEKAPHDAVAVLENILSEGNGQSSFAAAIIKIAIAKELVDRPATALPATPLQQPAGVPNAPQASMAELLQKQENTSQVMTPSLSRYIGGIFRNILDNILYFLRVKIFRQSPRRVRMAKDFHDYRPSGQSSLEQKHIASSLIAGSGRQVRRINTTLKNLGQSVKHLFARQDAAPDASLASHERQTLAQRMTRLVLAMKRLPMVSKLLLIGLIIVAFFLAQGIYSSAQNRQDSQQSSDYDQKIAAITNDINRAEANLSYGDEAGAKKFLAEAKILIDQLPNKTKDQKATIDELNGKLNSQMEKTKHIVDIASPTLVADLAKTDSTISPRDLALAGTTLYTTDAAKKTIYGISIGTSEVNSWPRDAADTFQYLLPEGANALLYLNTANGVGEFSVQSKKFTELAFTAPAEININGVALYEGRIYMIDIKGNQIYKSARAGNEFSKPASWIKDGTNVSDAVGLAVDGSIFVLYKNGAVSKFTTGDKQAWSLTAIEPALDKAEKIWTSTATDKLYILDSKGRRIVEFTKDGKFLNQYASAAFSALKNFAVDPTAKKMYVLNGTSIYTFNLK
ncbi:MAG: hypothetical protein V1668_01955 [Patescibacteria group bacterium]